MRIQIRHQVDEVCGPEISIQDLSPVVCRRIRQAAPGSRDSFGILKEHPILVSDRVAHDPSEIPFCGPVCWVLAVLYLDLGTLALEVVDDHRLLKSVEWPFKDAKTENSGSGNRSKFLVRNQRCWPLGRKHLIEQRVRIDYQSLACLFRVKHNLVIGSISGGVPLDVQLCCEC